MPYLTKQNLILGTQCEKAVWLQEHRPELAAERDAGAQLRMLQGNDVDAAAREIYGGGEFIAEEDWEAAQNQTAALVEAGVQRFYQPAFSAMGLRIRADILDVFPGRVAVLREVKMSTRLKDEHILDVATQVFVLQHCGFSVQQVYLVLINRAHTPENGELLFHEVDATKKALKLAQEMGAGLSTISNSVTSASEPEVRIGRHCTKPWTCPFYTHCWEGIPKASVLSIPRLSAKKLEALQLQNILHLEDLPANFSLTDTQQAYVRFQTTGTRTVNVQAIKEDLASFVYPLYFLDFETHSAPIPPYPGTRPYQQVPFQFSLHILDEKGTLKHLDYLHTTDSDPRHAVADHLVDYLGDSGTVLTYNAQFEIKVLNELADAVPERAEALGRIVSRVFDQLPLIRKNVKDPQLHRSYSLKTITKVLLDDPAYSALSIANGESAHAAWVHMHQITDNAERQQIIADLKAYCCQDTLAQVNLHRWCERLSEY